LVVKYSTVVVVGSGGARVRSGWFSGRGWFFGSDVKRMSGIFSEGNREPFSGLNMLG
jgi:hypothetical protein